MYTYTVMGSCYDAAMLTFSVVAPNIIQLFNCQGIQIGEKNRLIVTNEAKDIQTGKYFKQMFPICQE